MPIGQAAFCPLDRVRILGEDQLRFMLGESTTTSPISIHSIFDPRMHLQAGRDTRVLYVETYHMDIPVYRIEGSDFAWPEQAFIDLDLEADSPASDPQSLASKTYVAKLLNGQFAITNHAGECFCRLRKRNKECAVEAANVVAHLRSRHAFETIYGFDGRYDDVPCS